MKLIDNLNWRYATKKFDPLKVVRENDMERLKEAIRLSASAYGLQLYKVLVIRNKSYREELGKAAYNQPQITQASHIFVFCNYTGWDEGYIDEHIATISRTQGKSTQELSGYADSLKNGLSRLTEAEWSTWTQKQTYLALSNLLVACVELKIDACPMEGFERDKFDALLGLPERGLSTSVIAAVGYRSGEDPTQFRKKVRKPAKLLFEYLP